MRWQFHTTSVWRPKIWQKSRRANVRLRLATAHHESHAVSATVDMWQYLNAFDTRCFVLIINKEFHWTGCSFVNWDQLRPLVVAKFRWAVEGDLAEQEEEQRSLALEERSGSLLDGMAAASVGGSAVVASIAEFPWRTKTTTWILRLSLLDVLKGEELNKKTTMSDVKREEKELDLSPEVVTNYRTAAFLVLRIGNLLQSYFSKGIHMMLLYIDMTSHLACDRGGVEA
ncbi:hypothetical protein PIB30_049584 [Stylosanthes scabra]|uniref:Uncharacterized protein n=1 Tax=Stylosanthes scabra TaxID=79078 RepID=A0ABU6THT8_9FABA|nr:hypothetical protein [Stylosanthes scabra]